MNFADLMRHQKDLQLASGVQIPAEQPQRLQALFAECGEFIQALKPEWRWWGHQGKDVIGFTRSDLIFEAADILHFLLVEAIAIDFQPKGDDSWAIAWESDMRDGEYAYLLIEMLKWVVIPNGFHQAVVRYAWAMRKLGFTQQEIESAYLQKADFNRKHMEAIAHAI